MSTVVRVSNELATLARVRSASEHRSMASQIEYWAKLGRISEDNPDLPHWFIKETLLAIDEIDAGLGEEYRFGA